MDIITITAWWWFLLIYKCLVTLMTVVGNVAVLVATTRLSFVPERYTLASLATADLIQGATVQTSQIYLHVIKSAPEWLTTSQKFIDIASFAASTFSMCLICWVRWVGVKTPLASRVNQTITYMFVLWLLAAAMAVPASLEKFLGYFWNMCYVLSYPIITFWMPAFVMLISYLKILLVMRKPMDMPLRAHRGGPGQAEERTCDGGRQCMARSRLAWSTAALIIFSFLIGCAPFFIGLQLDILCHCVTNELQEIFTWLRYTNSAINPFVYAAASPSVKAAMQKIILRRRSILVDRCSCIT